MKRWAVPVLFAVLLVTGCARPPEQLVQQARAALQAAEEAGAPRLAPAAWERAGQAMGRLEAELERQEQAWRVLRRYGPARTLAEQAAEAANQALSEANARASQARAEALQVIEEVRGSLLSARRQLSALPAATAAQAAQLGPSLDAAERRLNLARADAEAGRLDAALLGASQAREQITAALRTMERLTGRPSSKKR